MSRDEHLAHMIREALQRSIDQQPHDPDMVERVAVGVGAALGDPAAEAREPRGSAGGTEREPDHGDHA